MPSYNRSLYGDLMYLRTPEQVYSHPGQLLVWDTEYKNPKDSRVKPQGPLWQNMTALPGQNMLYKEPAEKVYPVGDSSYHYWYFGGTAGSAPQPDWAKAIRLKIQELSVNLASSVAEWKQTADGFIYFANQIRRIRRQIVSRTSSRSNRLNFCDVSATHLAVHFGIKPVVQDLYDVVQTFNGAQPPIIRVHARAKETAKGLSTSEYIEEGKWTSSDYVVSYVQPKTFGEIDLGNPVEWAWELIPFSFVVDWALPVGEYLTSLFALQKVDVLATCVSQKRKYEGTTLYNPDWYPGYPYIPGKKGVVKYETHTRFVPTSIPLPDLPRFDVTDSILALQHAGALLHQLRKC